MKAAPPPRVSVYKDGNTWRWLCRLPLCCRSDWRGRQVDALDAAHRHLGEHDRFGFKR